MMMSCVNPVNANGEAVRWDSFDAGRTTSIKAGRLDADYSSLCGGVALKRDGGVSRVPNQRLPDGRFPVSCVR